MSRIIVLALVLAVPSIGEAKAEKPWRLGKATVTDEQMTLPLPGSDIREVDAARVHRSGQKRISVFFPDIRGRRMMKRYKKGPIRQVRMTRTRKGTTVQLTTRQYAGDVIDKLVVKAADEVQIVVDMNPEPAVLPNSPEVDAIVGDAETRVADQEVDKISRVAQGSSTMVASGFFALIVAALGIAMWFLKKHNKVQLEPESIDVVAVRAFGGRHKLALVETCGEKLLLAASDKGVTLLSHVGTQLVPPGGLDEAAQILSMETVPSFEEFMEPQPQQAVPQREVQPEPEQPIAQQAPAPTQARREEAHAFELATAKLNSGTLSADLEGLVKLREKRTAKTRQSVNGLATHLANKYKANEAAA